MWDIVSKVGDGKPLKYTTGIGGSEYCLLGLELYELTGKQIIEILEDDTNEGKYRFDHICYMFDENFKVVETDIHAEVIEKCDLETKYICFRDSNIEGLLYQAIGDFGSFVWMCENLDLSFIKDFETNPYNRIGQAGTKELHLVVYVGYSTSYDHYSGATEGELDISLEGYLNAEKQFVKL